MRLGALIIVTSLIAAACGGDRNRIDIEDPYVLPPLPGRDVAVGYFSANNRGEVARTLTGARSASAERVEIHTHVHDGDMMRMRRVDEVALEPARPVAFAPGGLHLMLFGVQLPDAGAVEVVLELDDGNEERVSFAVRPRNLRKSGESTQ